MAATRPRPRLHEPLARRLLRLHRVSARLQRVSLAPLVRPPQSAALGGARELPLPLQQDPEVGRGAQHALADRDRRAAAGAVRLRDRGDADRAKLGVGIFRTIFYLPALAPPVAAGARLRLPPKPCDRPGQHGARQARHRGPLWFNDPVGRSPRSTLLANVGRREHHGHLPRGDPGRAKHLHESAERRRRRVPAAALRDPADDQPGDPLRRRTRRDPGAPVLHPGVRGGGDRGRPGLAGGDGRARSNRAIRRARRSSTRSSSTTTASASSTWATPRRWRCCCSPSRSP